MKVHRKDGAPIKMWTDGVPVEHDALKQLENIASLPFIHKHVAVMPDVHLGRGATVGSVIATKGAIVPAAVGVDIGCGMMACKLSLNANELPDKLSLIRQCLEEAIPVGQASHKEVPRYSENIWYKYLKSDWELIDAMHPKISSKTSAAFQLGTLGGGNHFIEICLDEADDVWIMLHSGSRNVGNRIGSYFIEKAKKEMEKYFITLPDKDLAFLTENTEVYHHYWDALDWAQRYAGYNRKAMLTQAISGLSKAMGRDVFFDDSIVSCHHNYVAKENHFGENVLVTRKGAVRARMGDLGIIPGSMGARSYIVSGKGNPDSFHSCSHGAGRVMSRTEAKKRFTVEDHVRATEGIECRKDAGVIDETPASYKDIEAVMAAQSDLVEIKHTLRQIVCVKG